MDQLLYYRNCIGQVCVWVFSPCSTEKRNTQRARTLKILGNKFTDVLEEFEAGNYALLIHSEF